MLSLVAGIMCQLFKDRKEANLARKVNERSHTNYNCQIEAMKEKGGSKEEINRGNKKEG